MSKREKMAAGIGWGVDILRALVGSIIFVAFLIFLWPSLTTMRDNITGSGIWVILDPAFMPFVTTVMILFLLSTAITWIIPKPN